MTHVDNLLDEPREDAANDSEESSGDAVSEANGTVTVPSDREGEPATEAAEEAVVIWSGEHRQYWMPKSSGYTPRLVGAGLYTRRFAESETGHCGPEKKIEILSLEEALQGSEREEIQPGTVGEYLNDFHRGRTP